MRRITLRHCIALCCCLFGLFSVSSHGAESASLDPLLAELGEAKIKDMEPILVRIEAVSDETVLLLLRTLLNGNLYYIKAEKRSLANLKAMATFITKMFSPTKLTLTLISVMSIRFV